MDHIWREKDGKIIHDGDCRFWDKPNICTCGLLLFLSRRGDTSKYPDLHSDLGKHEYALDHAFRNPPPPLEPLSQTEAHELLTRLFGKDFPHEK